MKIIIVIMLGPKSGQHREKHYSKEGEGITGIVYLAQSPGKMSPTNILRSWVSLWWVIHALGRLESLTGT